MSATAEQIAAAHRRYKESIGTSREAIAYAALVEAIAYAALVAIVRGARSR